MQRLLVPLSLLVAVGVATTCTQDSDCPDSFCLDATCYAGDPATFRSTPTAGYTCRTARDCVPGFTCCNRLCRAPGDPALPNPFLDQEVRPDPPDCASLSDFPLSAGCRHTLLWCTPPYWIELDGMTGCTPQHCTSNSDCSDGYTCIITPVVPEGLCWHTGLGAAALKASQCDYAPRDGGSPKHDPAKDPPPPRDDGHRDDEGPGFVGRDVALADTSLAAVWIILAIIAFVLVLTCLVGSAHVTRRHWYARYGNGGAQRTTPIQLPPRTMSSPTRAGADLPPREWAPPRS